MKEPDRSPCKAEKSVLRWLLGQVLDFTKNGNVRTAESESRWRSNNLPEL